jgi:phosphate transport system substrate-binding protein
MEKYVKRSSQRVVALLAAASFALAACGSDSDSAEEPAAEDDGGIDYASVSGTLIGAGASSQKAGMLGWQVGFQSVAPNATVEYDPIGSGGGRKQFLGGGSDFAGSDAALKDEEWEASKEVCAGDLGCCWRYRTQRSRTYGDGSR